MSRVLFFRYNAANWKTPLHPSNKNTRKALPGRSDVFAKLVCNCPSIKAIMRYCTFQGLPSTYYHHYSMCLIFRIYASITELQKKTGGEKKNGITIKPSKLLTLSTYIRRSERIKQPSTTEVNL